MTKSFPSPQTMPSPNSQQVFNLPTMDIEINKPLAPLTWFKVGGCADYFFEPKSLRDLRYFLVNKPSHLPYCVLGAGSNLLVRDGGFRGVMISLKSMANVILKHEKDYLDVGASVLDRRAAKIACAESLSGLEFLYTIPGTIGGALRMNAGAFGSSLDDILVHAIAMDKKGNLHHISRNQMGFGYRKTHIPEDFIFLGARLKGNLEESHIIEQKMIALAEKRKASQPSGRTGGSTFKNPPDLKAWQLIDQAGLRGCTEGGAQISEKHCNFMLNTGHATATDLENLGERVRKTVLEKLGHTLEWEIKRIGSHAVT